MTLEEMKVRKRELGYTNEMIADKSGVPLGTVQKIFSGETSSPRYNTLKKLEESFIDENNKYSFDDSIKIADGMTAVLNYGKMDNGKNIAQEFSAYSVEKRLGVAAGKYKVPADSFFYDDEIVDMFEEC